MLNTLQIQESPDERGGGEAHIQNTKEDSGKRGRRGGVLEDSECERLMPRVLAALWGQRRAAGIGTLSAQARLEPETVLAILAELSRRRWVHRYQVAGQPALYRWSGPCTEGMLKTADMIRRLAWDLPLDSAII